MNLALPDHEKPGSGLGKVLARLARRIVSRIRALPEGEEGNIHDLRVSAKKMRSLLRLAKAVLGREKLSRLGAEIRGLKNAFSGSRDTEVMRATLAKFASDGGSLVREKAAKPLNLPRLLNRAQTLQRKIEALDFSRLSKGKLLKQAEKTYRKARKLCRKCADEPESELMHDWRKRVKDLQYQAQALKIPHHGAGRLADHLGEFNDLQVLSAHLRNRRVSVEIRDALAGSKSKLHKAALRAAKKVFEEKPGSWAAHAS